MDGAKRRFKLARLDLRSGFVLCLSECHSRERESERADAILVCLYVDKYVCKRNMRYPRVEQSVKHSVCASRIDIARGIYPELILLADKPWEP